MAETDSRDEGDRGETAKEVTDGTNEFISVPMDANIEACYVGKFQIPIKNLIPPHPARRVRALDERHVSNITKGMLDHSKMALTMASPLVGLIQSHLCGSRDQFQNSNVETHIIEVIDGNHSLHAQKSALQLSGDPTVRFREVILYVGLSDEQCKRVGILRNRDSANCLPMSDLDFVLLVRQEISRHFVEGKTPGKDPKSQEFWKRLYTMLGLKFENKTRDAKRPIETLAKLSHEEFSLVKKIFDKNPKLRASAIPKHLQKVTEEAERRKLLEACLESKTAFQEASVQVKGNELHIEVQGTMFIVSQGKKRLEARKISIASAGENLQLSTTELRNLLFRGERRQEKLSPPNVVSPASAEFSLTRTSTSTCHQPLRSKRSNAEGPMEEINSVKKNKSPEHPEEFFEDVSALSPESIATKLVIGDLVLCKPFKPKDYVEDDPFIYKIVSVHNKKFRGELMCGKTGQTYICGSKVWKNKSTADVPVSYIKAIMGWHLNKEMPPDMTLKIKSVY